LKKENRVKEIAIIGGPGGGKTSLFDYLARELPKHGIRSFVVEEYATKIINGGVPDIAKIAKDDPKKYIEIEREMLVTHLTDREGARRRARIFEDERCAIFCDRGGMDIKSYLPESVFEAILGERRLNLWDVRDSYDAVIFLRSAACGAEERYTTENNTARQEKDAEKAREADEATLAVWIGHPRLMIIESCEDFGEKMQRALQAILNVIGNFEIERKYLLKTKPNLLYKALKGAVKVSIEQMYLETGERIRRVNQNGYNAYYLTEKKLVAGAGGVLRKEEERGISALDYIYFSERCDPASKIIRKNRWYFVYNNQYFELDEILGPKKLWMLEIELIDENDPVKLPPFLKIDREVTGHQKYSNHNIARGL